MKTLHILFIIFFLLNKEVLSSDTAQVVSIQPSTLGATATMYLLMTIDDNVKLFSNGDFITAEITSGGLTFNSGGACTSISQGLTWNTCTYVSSTKITASTTSLGSNKLSSVYLIYPITNPSTSSTVSITLTHTLKLDNSQFTASTTFTGFAGSPAATVSLSPTYLYQNSVLTINFNCDTNNQATFANNDELVIIISGGATFQTSPTCTDPSSTVTWDVCTYDSAYQLIAQITSLGSGTQQNLQLQVPIINPSASETTSFTFNHQSSGTNTGTATATFSAYTVVTPTATVALTSTALTVQNFITITFNPDTNNNVKFVNSDSFTVTISSGAATIPTSVTCTTTTSSLTWDSCTRSSSTVLVASTTSLSTTQLSSVILKIPYQNPTTTETTTFTIKHSSSTNNKGSVTVTFSAYTAISPTVTASLSNKALGVASVLTLTINADTNNQVKLVDTDSLVASISSTNGGIYATSATCTTTTSSLTWDTCTRNSATQVTAVTTSLGATTMSSFILILPVTNPTSTETTTFTILHNYLGTTAEGSATTTFSAYTVISPSVSVSIVPTALGVLSALTLTFTTDSNGQVTFATGDSLVFSITSGSLSIPSSGVTCTTTTSGLTWNTCTRTSGTQLTALTSSLSGTLSSLILTIPVTNPSATETTSISVTHFSGATNEGLATTTFSGYTALSPTATVSVSPKSLGVLSYLTITFTTDTNGQITFANNDNLVITITGGATFPASVTCTTTTSGLTWNTCTRDSTTQLTTQTTSLSGTKTSVILVIPINNPSASESTSFTITHNTNSGSTFYGSATATFSGYTSLSPTATATISPTSLTTSAFLTITFQPDTNGEILFKNTDTLQVVMQTGTVAFAASVTCTTTTSSLAWSTCTRASGTQVTGQANALGSTTLSSLIITIPITNPAATETTTFQITHYVSGSSQAGQVIATFSSYTAISPSATASISPTSLTTTSFLTISFTMDTNNQVVFSNSDTLEVTVSSGTVTFPTSPTCTTTTSSLTWNSCTRSSTTVLTAQTTSLSTTTLTSAILKFPIQNPTSTETTTFTIKHYTSSGATLVGTTTATFSAYTAISPTATASITPTSLTTAASLTLSFTMDSNSQVLFQNSESMVVSVSSGALVFASSVTCTTTTSSLSWNVCTRDSSTQITMQATGLGSTTLSSVIMTLPVTNPSATETTTFTITHYTSSSVQIGQTTATFSAYTAISPTATASITPTSLTTAASVTLSFTMDSNNQVLFKNSESMVVSVSSGALVFDSSVTCTTTTSSLSWNVCTRDSSTQITMQATGLGSTTLSSVTMTLPVTNPSATETTTFTITHYTSSSVQIGQTTATFSAYTAISPTATASITPTSLTTTASVTLTFTMDSNNQVLFKNSESMVVSVTSGTLTFDSSVTCTTTTASLTWNTCTRDSSTQITMTTSSLSTTTLSSAIMTLPVQNPTATETTTFTITHFTSSSVAIGQTTATFSAYTAISPTATAAITPTSLTTPASLTLTFNMDSNSQVLFKNSESMIISVTSGTLVFASSVTCTTTTSSLTWNVCTRDSSTQITLKTTSLSSTTLSSVIMTVPVTNPSATETTTFTITHYTSGSVAEGSTTATFSAYTAISPSVTAAISPTSFGASSFLTLTVNTDTNNQVLFKNQDTLVVSTSGSTSLFPSTLSCTTTTATLTWNTCTQNSATQITAQTTSLSGTLQNIILKLAFYNPTAAETTTFTIKHYTDSGVTLVGTTTATFSAYTTLSPTATATISPTALIVSSVLTISFNCDTNNQVIFSNSDTLEVVVSSGAAAFPSTVTCTTTTSSLTWDTCTYTSATKVTAISTSLGSTTLQILEVKIPFVNPTSTETTSFTVTHYRGSLSQGSATATFSAYTAIAATATITSVTPQTLGFSSFIVFSFTMDTNSQVLFINSDKMVITVQTGTATFPSSSPTCTGSAPTWNTCVQDSTTQITATATSLSTSTLSSAVITIPMTNPSAAETTVFQLTHYRSSTAIGVATVNYNSYTTLSPSTSVSVSPTALGLPSVLTITFQSDTNSQIKYINNDNLQFSVSTGTTTLPTSVTCTTTTSSLTWNTCSRTSSTALTATSTSLGSTTLSTVILIIPIINPSASETTSFTIAHVSGSTNEGSSIGTFSAYTAIAPTATTVISPASTTILSSLTVTFICDSNSQVTFANGDQLVVEVTSGTATFPSSPTCTGTSPIWNTCTRDSTTKITATASSLGSSTLTSVTLTIPIQNPSASETTTFTLTHNSGVYNAGSITSTFSAYTLLVPTASVAIVPATFSLIAALTITINTDTNNQVKLANNDILIITITGGTATFPTSVTCITTTSTLTWNVCTRNSATQLTTQTTSLGTSLQNIILTIPIINPTSAETTTFSIAHQTSAGSAEGTPTATFNSYFALAPTATTAISQTDLGTPAILTITFGTDTNGQVTFGNGDSLIVAITGTATFLTTVTCTTTTASLTFDTCTRNSATQITATTSSLGTTTLSSLILKIPVLNPSASETTTYTVTHTSSSQTEGSAAGTISSYTTLSPSATITVSPTPLQLPSFLTVSFTTDASSQITFINSDTLVIVITGGATFSSSVTCTTSTSSLTWDVCTRNSATQLTAQSTSLGSTTLSSLELKVPIVNPTSAETTSFAITHYYGTYNVGSVTQTFSAYTTPVIPSAAISLSTSACSASSSLTLNLNTDTNSNYLFADSNSLVITLSGDATFLATITCTTSTASLTWDVCTRNSATQITVKTTSLGSTTLQNIQLVVPFQNPTFVETTSFKISILDSSNVLQGQTTTSYSSYIATQVTTKPSTTLTQSTNCYNTNEHSITQSTMKNTGTGATYSQTWSFTIPGTSSWAGCYYDHQYPFSFTQTKAGTSTDTIELNAAVYSWAMIIDSNKITCQHPSAGLLTSSSSSTLSTKGLQYKQGQMLIGAEGPACGYTVWYGWSGSTATSLTVTVLTNGDKLLHQINTTIYAMVIIFISVNIYII